MRLIFFIAIIYSFSSLAQRPNYKEFGFAHDYDRIFQYVHKLMERKGVQKMFNEIFENELIIPDELMKKYNLTKNKVPFTENQLLFLLTKNEDLFALVDSYLEEFPSNISLDDLKDEYRELKKLKESNKTNTLRGDNLKRWKKLEKRIAQLEDTKQKFHSIIDTPEVRGEFVRLNDPFQPVKLKMENDGIGFKIDPEKGYITTHERKIKGNIQSGDDGVKFITDFIDEAEHQVKIMVFEQDLDEVADAIERALERGVTVENGLDGKHINTDAKVKYVERMKQLQKKYPNLFEFKAIETSVGLDHGKTFIRDWDFPGKGAVIISTANTTQSGIHPEGDIKGLDPKTKPKNIRPNANQMHLVESDLYALATKYEIDKTFKMGLRGKSDMWPTSFYELKGESFKQFKNKNSRFMFAFTPGGLDDPGKYFLSNLIELSNGPIKMSLFAASSDDFANTVVDYTIKQFEAGIDKPFRSVMDVGFATRFYSMLFKIGGYKEIYRDKKGNEITRLEAQEFDKAKPKIPYDRDIIDDVDSYAYKKYSKKQLKIIRENMMLANEYYKNSNFFDFDTGKNIDVSSKIHLKTFATDNVVQSGSYNYSPNANSNKEVLIGIVDHPVVLKQHEAFEGLISLSEMSIDDKITLKNIMWQNNFEGSCRQFMLKIK